MSILIKGMEMPKSCGFCRLKHADIVHGDVCSVKIGLWCEFQKRPDDCPLAPVSAPHDRLTNADALENEGASIQAVNTRESCKEYVEWKKAASEGRLVILPAPAKKGEPKPKCYSEMLFCEGLCNGYSSGDDDEPTERCKNCWYCEFSYARLEEEEKAEES